MLAAAGGQWPLHVSGRSGFPAGGAASHQRGQTVAGGQPVSILRREFAISGHSFETPKVAVAATSRAAERLFCLSDTAGACPDRPSSGPRARSPACKRFAGCAAFSRFAGFALAMRTINGKIDGYGQSTLADRIAPAARSYPFNGTGYSSHSSYTPIRGKGHHASDMAASIVFPCARFDSPGAPPS
jgi:hypothetical protein